MEISCEISLINEHIRVADIWDTLSSFPQPDKMGGDAMIQDAKKVSEQKMVSVILAAGKGTRMGNPRLHKVCFPLENKTVIERSIELYERCGIDAHCIVIGALAEQVMEAASFVSPRVSFVYQREQTGTGNAAKMAAHFLSAANFKGDVLVVAGDKVMEESILTRLIRIFREGENDLAFVVGDISDFPGAGRIICDERGNVIANVEVFDIARYELLTSLEQMAAGRLVTAQEAEHLALSYLKQEGKASLALGSLWDIIKSGNPITTEVIQSCFAESDFSLYSCGHHITPEQIVRAKYANQSIYLFKADALYSAVEHLTADNAQEEEYLPDVIAILTAQGRRLDMVHLACPEEVMTYNTPEELSAIQDYYSRKKKDIELAATPKTIRQAGEWLKALQDESPSAIRALGQIYGEGHPSVQGKRRQLVAMLKRYREIFRDEDVLISRAPGRVNIMGRHIDHQGGHGNMIAIDRDFFMIAGVRDDREIRLCNMEPHHFPDRLLNIDELFSGYTGGDWLDYVNSNEVRRRVEASHGNWSQYIISPIIRFQAKFPRKRLCGMNILASGSIPIAAGVSSSSAIVVAATEAILHLNGLEVIPEEFVELCGEAEWYVGTRGGAGDHAAMKFAKRNHVVQVAFFPFGVTNVVPFPTNYLFVICNSHEKARKTAEAKDIFNHRVACYHIGREFLKMKFPSHAMNIHHLRDINTRTMGISYPELLSMLKALPNTLTRNEVMSHLPHALVEQYSGTHEGIFDSYPIRTIVLYGLAECERSRMCPELLIRGEAETFGRWMNVSHNGDRVAIWGRGGISRPFRIDYSDDAIEQLILDARKGLAQAELVNQPGAYGCSIPQIDHMADIALSVEGVIGAQILGAGLGGCMMALVHKDAWENLQYALGRHYYDAANLEPDMFICHPVAGSGILSF